MRQLGKRLLAGTGNVWRNWYGKQMALKLKNYDEMKK